MNDAVKKILLATDGSAEGDLAARTAAGISNSLGAELHTLYVRPMPEAYVNHWAVSDPNLMERLVEGTRREAREKAEEEAKKLGEAGARVSRVHARAGRADDEIVRLAEDLGAWMVVVGSRGLGAMRRALVGSVSMSVVRHSHGSVFVVRDGGREESVFPGKILVAVDGSKEAEAALEEAVEISRSTGSGLHVLYVLYDRPLSPYPHPLAMEGWESSLEEVKEEAREFVEKKANLARESGAEVEWSGVALGDPEKEIVRHAEEIGAAAILVGSRGLGGVRRSLMGSVSDSVVRHAHCPVLVVRRPARASNGERKGAQ